MWNNTFTCIKVIFSLCLAAGLMACDGEDTEEAVSDLPDNLVIETLQFDQHSFDFDKNKTGPYEIQVESTVDTIRFSATRQSETTDLTYLLNNSQPISGELITLTSGQAVTLELTEGDNLLRVFANDTESDLFISYTVNIKKPSTSARLGNLQFSEFGAEEPRTLSPAFSRETYFYSVNLDYEDCSYAMAYRADKPDNGIRIDGEDVSASNTYFGNLDTGDNYIDIFVSSGASAPADAEEEDEGGQTASLREERYTIQVTRSEPTEAQQNQNANLRRLSIEGQELDFLCGQNSYTVAVNKQTGLLRLTLESEVDGVNMLYEGQDIENNVPIEIELEPDTDSLSIAVESLDGSVTNTYQILLNRLNTNRLIVDSVEALQRALQNARANDEIRLKPGVYEGVAGLTTSGNEQAGFYSAQSGSRLLPIVLTADEPISRSDADPRQNLVILKVANNGETGENPIDVLRLSGNYWRVSNIHIEGGDYGVQVSRADHITLENLELSEFKRSAVSVSGSDNQVLDSTLRQSTSDTAAALLHIQGDADTAALVSNNTVSRNRFEVTQATPAILLGVLSENSDILSNDIRSSAAAAAPLISVSGNQTQIRFNHFLPSANTSTAIAIEPQTVAEQSWGNQAEIYQNALARSRPDLLFIQANAAQGINVGENYLSALTFDEDTPTAVNYEGGNVEAQEQVSPAFRISPAESPEDCLGLRASESISDLFFVNLKPCGEEDEFYWQFEFSSSNYVYIKNRSQEDGYLSNSSALFASCPTIESEEIQLSAARLADNVSGFVQQWAINFDADGYWFTNKFDDNFALSIGGSTYGTGSPALVCGFIDSERQKFVLKD